MLASVHPIQEIPDRPYLKPTFDFLLVVVLNDDNKGTNLRVLKRKGSLNVTTNATVWGVIFETSQRTS